MPVENIAKLFDIAKKKNQFDQNHSWSQGSSTYLAEMKKELAEVEEEIPLDRICYLEDELGDVLWDYLNMLLCLEKEKNISAHNVFKRAHQKYEERIAGIESGVKWAKIKAGQKERLAAEYILEKTDSNHIE